MTTETPAAIETEEQAKRLNRDGRKKREMRNLIRRGRVWYFKKMVDGKVKPISLNTEDLALAKTKRDENERLALDGEWEKIEGPRTHNGTLQEVFDLYESRAAITHKAVIGNKSALMTICRVALKDKDLEPNGVKLTVLTPRLVRDYQDLVRAEYQEKAGKNEDARRVAREKADRSTKSTFNQAKSIFANHGKTTQWIQRYQEAGIAVPDCVKEFCKAGAVGKLTRSVYFPPSDKQIAETFTNVEALKETDPECYYLFWLALATGARRNELADMKVQDLQLISGRRWVTAGLGKNGEPIRIPLIGWQVHPANPRTPASVVEELLKDRTDGFLFKGEYRERYDEMPDRLNGWLFRQGWTDEKKLHNIRAFIGCKVYMKNPRLAQLYMRHESIETTENHYSQFLDLSEVFKFDDVTPPIAPTAAPVLHIVQTPGQEVAA